MEHVPFDSDVFVEAFSPDELRLIRDFNLTVEAAFAPYQRNCPKVDVRLRERAWKRVTEAASGIVARLRSAN